MAIKSLFKAFPEHAYTFQKKTDLLFVCDVTLLLARDGVRLCNGKNTFITEGEVSNQFQRVEIFLRDS